MSSPVAGLSLVERDERHGRRRLSLVDERGSDACWLTIDPLEVQDGAGRRVPVLGIGNVNTVTPQRRRGLASRLLRIAVDRMRTDGADASLLYGIDGFYERLGWRSWGDERWVEVDVDGLEPPAGADVSARPLTGADVPILQEAYDRIAASIVGADSRTSGRAWAQLDPRDVTLVERAGQVAGWAWLGAGRVPERDAAEQRAAAGTVVFAELQAVDEAAMLAVVRAATDAALRREPRCRRISTGAPEGHALRRLARRGVFGGRLVDELRPHGGAMLLPFTDVGTRLLAARDPYQFLPDRF